MYQAVLEHAIPRVETEKNVDGSGEAVFVSTTLLGKSKGTRRIVCKYHSAIKYKDFNL